MKNTLLNILSFSILIAASTMSAQAKYEFDESSPIIQFLRSSPSQPLDHLNNAKDNHAEVEFGSLIKIRALADQVAGELRDLCAQPSASQADREALGKKWIDEYFKVELPGIMNGRSWTPASKEVYNSMAYALCFLGDDIQSID